MKKLILGSILLLCLFGMAGCSKKEINITAEEISANTMLVKRNGALYVAFVEEFDKPYYNLSELEEFVTKEVNTYNEKAGSNEVKIEELKLKDSKAVMLLSFSGMAHYSAFNEVAAAYFSADTQNVALELPEQYVSAKNESKVDKATAFKSGKNRVLVVYEPYEIIVEGSIKYYSENAKLSAEGDSVLSDEGTTVLIYKP